MKKFCLVLLGFLLVISNIASAWDEEKDESLSNEVFKSRLVRSPEGLKRRNKVRKPQRKRKTNRKKGRKSVKKGRKSLTKGRKSVKKGRKSVKKGRKSAKKGRKSQTKGRKSFNNGKSKNFKRKSRRKPRRKKGRISKSGSNSRRSERVVSDICFEKSVTIMRMWKDVISSFERKKKRMEKQNSTGVNKSGKKGVFGPIALRLIEVGGGDRSAPSCGGRTGNAGARQLRNLTDTLSACEADIQDSCGSFTQPNMTKLSECVKVTEKFKTGARNCVDMTIGTNKTNADTACMCWTDADLDKTVEAAKNCQITTEAQTIAGELRKCIATFSKCRKFEDDVITAITACSSDATSMIKKVSLVEMYADQAIQSLLRVDKLSDKTLALEQKKQISKSNICNFIFPIS